MHHHFTVKVLQECFDVLFIHEKHRGLLGFEDQLYKRINTLMKELKALHKMFPVILFLDEIKIESGCNQDKI